MSMTATARKILGDAARRIPWVRRQLFASVDYTVITREEALSLRDGGWSLGLTARRQRRAYEHLLRLMRDGSPRIDLTVAIDAIRATGLNHPSILEVGCGGGSFSEVFSHYLSDSFDYFGIDSSTAMVDLARRSYPTRRFEVADACALDLPSGSMDIVFDGVALMHILQFERAIAESRRVARSFCIYHSVPVFTSGPTRYLRKYAYGGLVVEVIFNRDELLQIFRAHGLELVRSWPSIAYDVYPATEEHSTCETLLLKVVRGDSAHH